MKRQKATIYDGRKKFTCPDCDFKFKKLSTMKKHVFKIHHVKKPDGIKPFHCSMCDVKFASERFLKSHVGIVHKNMEIGGEKQKMVNCIICDAELFDDHKSLENHFESAHDVKKSGDSGQIYENQNEKFINCQVCDTEFDDP